LPYWNEFCYSERHRVGYFEAAATPRRIREYYGLYASCVDGFRAMKQAEADRAARRG